MPSGAWRPDADLSSLDEASSKRLQRSLEQEAYGFAFFQLVYLVERWLGANRPALGTIGPPEREAISLRPDERLSFSPADVRRIEPIVDDAGNSDPERRRLVVNFMGLYGIAAPSPVYLTELLNYEDMDAEPLRDFLDLFNHRLLSLFFRAWQKYRYPYRYEPGAVDSFSSYVFSFAGLRENEVRRETHLPTPRLLKYTGLLGLPTRPLSGLRRLISDYFRLDSVRIRPWLLGWVEIEEGRQNRIGRDNCVLGKSLSLGERVPDRTSRFRVRIGPISYATFLEFLPNTEKFRQLCALVRLWVGERFDVDYELIIDRRQIPEAQLAEKSSMRLGWTGWITSGPGLAKDPSVLFSACRTAPQGAAA